ncbi:MAG: hypothetical protein LBT64_02120, partial [Puniceicoccales bacterium]|nr:hypothetical protein [Puniceicoccales bacterium]
MKIDSLKKDGIAANAGANIEDNNSIEEENVEIQNTYGGKTLQPNDGKTANHMGKIANNAVDQKGMEVRAPEQAKHKHGTLELFNFHRKGTATPDTQTKQSDQAYGEQSANITANVKKWINHLLKDKTKKFKKDTLPATDTSASAKISTISSKEITSSFDVEFHGIVKKFKIIVNAASDGREIDAKNKLTWAEFRQIRDISRAVAEGKNISQMKDFFRNATKILSYPQLQRDIDSCHTLYERFNAIFRKEMEGSIEGDISVVDTWKDLLSGRRYGFSDLDKYVMGRVDVEREDFEIVGTSEKTPKTITYDALESIFRGRYTIDPNKLLKSSAMEELKSIIGLSEKDLQAEFRTQKRKVLDDNSDRIISESFGNNFSALFLPIVETLKEFLKRCVEPDYEKWATPLSKN